MLIDFFSSQLINAFISHVRNLEFGRCLNDLPRMQIGALEIRYTCGTSSRQVLCLFHYIPCDRIGGRHLVLFGLHYSKKGMTYPGPYARLANRRMKGIYMKSCEEYYVYIFLLNGARQLRTGMASNCRLPFRDFAIPVWLSYIGSKLP